ncbi:MAG: hypothetical protein KGL39_41780 [Patescibacteria group bacterium]|nr:hypothetical protein [Patescibacteria group bacterium]
MKWSWQRVTKRTPCPQCKHEDWCSFCPDLNLVLCMRVESQRPSKNAMGGWIHSLDADAKKFIPRHVDTEQPTIDASKVMQEFSFDTIESELSKFAESLGVTSQSLKMLGCQRAKKHHAWAFPMKDGSGRTVGIRLRGDDGSKFAIRGSRQGIFLPNCHTDKTAYIVEGVSDTAALISIGLFGFGRPQCCGSIAVITATVSRLRIQEVIIIADNDEPGIKGAKQLSSELDIPSCILLPPCKDLRQMLSWGATADLIHSLVSNLVWNLPQRRKYNYENPDEILTT